MTDGRSRSDDGGAARPGPLLLATRFEEEAAATARTAVRLSDALGLDLTVLYVAVELDTTRLVASHSGLREDLAEREMLTRLEEHARDYAADWFGERDFDVVVSRGPVVDAIVEHAEQAAATLLVVGHHEHGPLARLFGADPAHDLLERVPCPVVIVPLR